MLIGLFTQAPFRQEFIAKGELTKYGVNTKLGRKLGCQIRARV